MRLLKSTFLILSITTATAASTSQSYDWIYVDGTWQYQGKAPTQEQSTQKSREELYLDVQLHGRDTEIIADFIRDPITGEISGSRRTLRDAGIKISPFGFGPVVLSKIEGLDYEYNALKQSINLKPSAEIMLRRDLTARRRSKDVALQGDWMLAFNYRLNGQWERQPTGLKQLGARADIDAFMTTPIGVLQGGWRISEANYLYGGRRIDRDRVYFSTANTRYMMAVEIGDIISTGMNRSAVELGGIQIRRDFSLTPNQNNRTRLGYVTTIALPSTIEVYIDDVRVYKADIEPGPIEINSLPKVSGRGEALVVITDYLGNERRELVSFNTQMSTLRPGFWEANLDAGVLRYKNANNRVIYGDVPAVSASLRYGFNKSHTIEGGFDITKSFTSLHFGVNGEYENGWSIRPSASISKYHDLIGFSANFDLEKRWDRVSLLASFSHFDRNYRTLVHALRPEITQSIDFNAYYSANLKLSYQFDAFSLGFSYDATKGTNRLDRRIGASMSTHLPWNNARLNSSASYNLATQNATMQIGLSMPLGAEISTSASLQRDETGSLRSYLNFRRALKNTNNSYGYIVSASQYGDNNVSLDAQFQYRSSLGLLSAGVNHTLNSSNTRLSLGFEGGAAISPNGIAIGGTVQGAYALVNVGLPNVPVYLYGSEVTRSNLFGTALVSNMRPYRNNQISVRWSDLPEDSSIDITGINITPYKYGGISANFGARIQRSALVELVDKTGEYVEAGSTATLNGRESKFYVGRDGELWLEGIEDRNEIKILTKTGICIAKFDDEQLSTGESYKNVICD